MKFKGDIIITDPCYLHLKDSVLDLFSSDEGYNEWGMWSTTYYGDWSCTTFKDDPKAIKTLKDLNKNYTELWNTSNSKKRALKKLEEERKKIEKDSGLILGHFCADGGMVGVFLLDKVLKLNPKFDYHINNPWTTTLIKDFNGDVKFETKKDKDSFTSLSIVGKGNVNFFTTQTGL